MDVKSQLMFKSMNLLVIQVSSEWFTKFREPLFFLIFKFMAHITTYIQVTGVGEVEQ